MHLDLGALAERRDHRGDCVVSGKGTRCVGDHGPVVVEERTRQTGDQLTALRGERPGRTITTRCRSTFAQPFPCAERGVRGICHLIGERSPGGIDASDLADENLVVGISLVRALDQIPVEQRPAVKRAQGEQSAESIGVLRLRQCQRVDQRERRGVGDSIRVVAVIGVAQPLRHLKSTETVAPVRRDPRSREWHRAAAEAGAPHGDNWPLHPRQCGDFGKRDEQGRRIRRGGRISRPASVRGTCSGHEATLATSYNISMKVLITRLIRVSIA